MTARLKLAAAPISWGVCEVPGWGRVLDPDTVLGEMAGLGLTATELGPPGYLPTEPERLRALLDRHGLRLVGGFLAVVLHDADQQADTVAEADRAAAQLAGAGAEVLVLAAATGLPGYDTKPELDDGRWRTLIRTAAQVEAVAAAHGLRTVLHPHVGTQVETEPEVRRFVTDSGLDLCLDTGHLLIGGTDPVELARRYPDRIGHVHLKDVRLTLAEAVRSGELGYARAVAEGIYPPLGAGQVDLAALVRLLTEAGYAGWYVLEQDTCLAAASTAADDRPREDTARSMAHLHTIVSQLPANQPGQPT